MLFGHRPGRLPTPRTALIGRASEIDEIASLVLTGRERLVTLTGIGGCGKTSLALEVAERLRTRFPDGVYLAGFSAIGDAGLVVGTVNEALGVRSDPSDDPISALV